MEAEKKAAVCVTGAGGFLASWVVKLLLSKGYVVHGTVRDPYEKCADLSKLEGASDNLKLFKADLLDYGSLLSAIEGCVGVLHVACPVPSSSVSNPEVELVEPAVKGTLNVLKASLEAKVKRVVYVSSIAAVAMNPNWPKEKIMDETCWSDEEYCKNTDNWYCFSKTEAENAAFKFAKEEGLDVVAVCPGLILGPLMLNRLNASTLVLVKLVNGNQDAILNKLRYIVDVRDVAKAVIMAFEKTEAEGRYICIAHSIETRELVDKLQSLYPDFSYTNNYIEAENKRKLSFERLQKLGWTYRQLHETIVDSIESYLKAGLLK